MQEIADLFAEELQELLDRYKDRLTNPQIMRVAQHIFHETLAVSKHPERLQGVGYAPGFPIIDELDHKVVKRDYKGVWRSEELEGSAGRDAVAGMMTPQEHMFAARDYALKGVDKCTD